MGEDIAVIRKYIAWSFWLTLIGGVIGFLSSIAGMFSIGSKINKVSAPAKETK
jgi:hypothetical protein